MKIVSTRSRIFASVVLCLLAKLCVPAVSLAEGGGSVNGRVVDQTNLPLPGVSVQLRPRMTGEFIEKTTDGDGTYRFSDVPVGPAEIIFRMINFITIRQELIVTSGGTVTADTMMIIATSADITVTAPRTFRNLAELENPSENLVGFANAGSEGAITAAQLSRRPVNRAAEILETIPGMIISQHSGEGKANQYYLRGFNLDHGFDFAQTIAGVPVNMPTHAHAQGYADSNFLIPELVSGVQFRKGPYYAESGDFSSAGSANINYLNALDRPIISLSSGSFGYTRFLGAVSPTVGPGNLLAAFEYEKDDGPWDSPNGLDKYNLVARYTQGNSRTGFSVTFMGYENHWHSTDQIPQRAVASGRIGRFGFIEETDGGETYRYNGVFDWQRSGTNNSTRVIGYVQRYGVQLFHNFTYFLNDPVNGDQFEQFEERWTAGGKITHRWIKSVAGYSTENLFGVDVRNDSVGGPLGLYLTRATERYSEVRADESDQTSIGVFGQTEVEWSPILRTTVGLRGDVYHWNVQASNPLNSGIETSGILSPKVSTAFAPWNGTELYVNWGLGFHSNSALGITLAVDPFTGDPAMPSPTFARAQGVEFGVRTVAIPKLQITATVWYLGFDSELIYVGDSGSTENGPATRRVGIEITNYFYPNPWVVADLDLSFSRARFVDMPPGEEYVTGALNRVLSAGATFQPPGSVPTGPFGSLRVRHFGPRALLADNNIRSNQTTIINAEAGYKFSDRLQLSLEGFNLLNARVSDIEYFFASRLPGEPAGGVEDTHFHAAIPRSLRMTARVNF
jgi:hypothetical protein